MSNNTQHLSFHSWLISFNIIASSSEYSAINNRTLLLFMAEIFPLCIYTTFSLSNLSLIDFKLFPVL